MAYYITRGQTLCEVSQNKMGLILMRKYCYEHLDASLKVEGESVDTRELDEFLEKLEIIASLGEMEKELEEKEKVKSSLINYVLVKTTGRPF